MPPLAPQSSSDDYALRRDYLASSRLNIQSRLWRDSLGYTIHPCIPKLQDDARIADIGTGTGTWMVEFALQKQSTTIQLDGFDIDISQCPPSQWLPPNIEFRLWNAFNDVPTSLHGVYDLVHIRLFMINIKNNDPSAIIQNAYKMLKPGGWLQWEEVDNTNNHLVKLDDSLEVPAMESLLNYIHVGSRNHRGGDEWFLNIVNTLGSSDFANVTLKPHEDPPILRRWVFETWLLTLEEFSTTKLRGTEQETTNLRLIKEAYEESKLGAVIQLGKLVCIAQKLG
ncbi:hypothetical protein HYALB_00005439 [Hymenoscyphus albidus]|uniref:S-adenosyl-L-methionine-dependent methyltransferase n=1 Tax=Hymenoscyphus albidus TaxID=595503 RepID=A0A9N9LCE8_9HELO|nr:hypothetical protein HYALB_00005439 [Hymenoscyphus albidus]